MNYTENHHLPQWASSDRVRMEDFNQMNQRIEEGLTQAFSPSNLPYVIGSYTGKGGKYNVTVTLPFEPSMVIVSGVTEGTDSSDSCRYMAVTRNNTNVRRRIQIFYNGFVVYCVGDGGPNSPELNEAGRHYDYIAFR